MEDEIERPSQSLFLERVHFFRPWEIVRPRVYRMLEKVYVDMFFDDGSIRLSSFSAFSRHEDQQRKDEHEGLGLREGTGNKATVVYVGGKGRNAFVLCGSTLCTKDLCDSFPQYDACFCIDNTVDFASVISTRLPSFINGVQGPAIYQDDVTIRKDLGELDLAAQMEQYTNPDGTIDMEFLSKEVIDRIGGIEELFMKRATYAYQSEYRLLWQCAVEIPTYIDIKVPEARQFCRRVR